MATGEARMLDAASLPSRSALPRDVGVFAVLLTIDVIVAIPVLCYFACRPPTGRADRRARHGAV
jgi:hypothetical protein